MEHKLLEIKGLKTQFIGDKKIIPAVDGVDLTIHRSETLALVGESGCGKSITSLSIMGLIPENGKISAGEIIFNGEDLTKKSEKELERIRGNDVSMIFQEPMTSLNPVLTIGEQLTEGLIIHDKLSKQEANARVIEMLKLVGFARAEEILSEYPHQLSGGMRQRVMIAMAMATNPKLLIADEPTTALDVTIQAQILELMKELKEQFQTSILLITHDLGIVADMADRVVVMYAGQVVEEAEVESLYENPAHPYTEGLMKSIPSLEKEQKRLYSIQGYVPAPDEFPIGCRFAPRCEKAMEICHEKAPNIYSLGNGHHVRCFLYKELEEIVEQ
ncbi:ABC transporter ATP-binding protein [Thermoflavimicrobium daqui]|jgi:oligopeptide/dipeptide ABC transporter ATP-binding protein|uniref:Peptide ABC transporter ATP-binding protein n=1 Tax=Thermoflavimicrobium daqui TaxID=2137476 RepID=A0A364K0Z2_9BACL|nr:ABC transporter ATP-binding protein [Thermoflavimicrobium daqui]RAL21356.1 peptide ABC transporter ATP-binding protein [Thermoflavimicrobium daqui]